MTRLAVVCAWCKKPKTPEDARLLADGALVTHGICEGCEEELEDSLDVRPTPSTPWDECEWWPVWDPIPRKPWRLVNEKGESKRDEEGQTLRFDKNPGDIRKENR